MQRLNNLTAPVATETSNPKTVQLPYNRKHKVMLTPTKAPSKRGKHTSNAGTDQEIPTPPDAGDFSTMQAEPTTPSQEAENMIQTPIRNFNTPPQDPVAKNLDDDDILDAMHAQTQQHQPQPQSSLQEILGTRTKGNKAKKC